MCPATQELDRSGRVNSAFCDDNHGFRPVDPIKTRCHLRMKAKSSTPERTLKIFEEAMRKSKAAE